MTDDEPRETEAPRATSINHRTRRRDPEPVVVVLLVLCVGAAILAVLAVVLWFTSA